MKRIGSKLILGLSSLKFQNDRRFRTGFGSQEFDSHGVLVDLPDPNKFVSDDQDSQTLSGSLNVKIVQGSTATTRPKSLV